MLARDSPNSTVYDGFLAGEDDAYVVLIDAPEDDERIVSLSTLLEDSKRRGVLTPIKLNSTVVTFINIFFRMYGLFQTSFYFGYMALFSGALGMMCGTLGYVGTSFFVRKIYSTVKID